MKEKNDMKIEKEKIIKPKNENGITLINLTVIIMILLILIGVTLIIANQFNVQETNVTNSELNHYYTEINDDTTYYIIEDDYSGEYNIQYTNLYDYSDEYVESYALSQYMSYEEYISYCEKWNFEKTYSDEDCYYFVFSYVSIGSPNIKARLAGIEYNDDTTTLYIWDDASGVTADSAAYAIFIPTVATTNNINVQNVYELEEYYTIIGKAPNEGANYSSDENAILAENAYIYSNNEKVNEIFNTMLDNIVQSHTIEISKNDNLVEIIDLASSASMRAYGSGIYYIAYGEEYSKNYREMGSSYEFTYGLSRSYILFDVSIYYEWDVVLGLSNEEINPYYYEAYPLVDTTDYSCSLDEDDEYYIINFNFPEEGTDEYYINKSTFLLEKSVAEHRNFDYEMTYEYTEREVTIPDEVFENSYEEVSIDKPIIYIYPEEETEVSVVLGNSECLTTSYPKYTNGWNVLAKEDGTLIDLETNRELYSLYYESKANINFEVTREGFCVKGEDVAEFLEEKLAILGLTEREAEEFIIYWLPILQENEYNYIRFATSEEIEENMPLEIDPEPDTIIRVLMTYKGLDEPIEVEEQNLITPERAGFVAVEWGGTEIK